MGRKKKASKKKVAAKNVSHEKGNESVTKEVQVDAPLDPEQEPAAAPAIVEERTLKVVDKGQTLYYTQSEYDEKYGKKAK
jgi:hypothetical protein